MTICDIVCKRYYKKVGEAPPYEKVVSAKPPGSEPQPDDNAEEPEEKED